MQITEFVSQFKTHPVLFMGAGMSLRYYKGAYSWDSLLKKIAYGLFYEKEELYLDLKNKYTKEKSCDFSGVALDLSGKIDQKLGAQDGFSGTRTLSDFEESINSQFYALVKSEGTASRIKIWVRELLSKLKIDAAKEDEILLLKDACKNVASIVTTNYDTFIEDRLNFTPLIGNDILLSNPYQSVYKIHGCLTNPSSMILTSEDYENFNRRYELIRAQLISLFIQSPIIFIGYGLQDKNIQGLLSTIFSYVSPESELGNRVVNNFLCVQFEPNSENIDVEQENFSIQTADRHINIRLNVLRTDNFAALYQQIAELQLPVEAIHLKRVANVIHTIKSGGEIAVKIVGDLEDADNRDLVLAIGPSAMVSVSLDQIYSAKDAVLNYFHITEHFQIGMVVLTENISSNMFFPAMGLSSVYSDMKNTNRLINQEKALLGNVYRSIKGEGWEALENTTIDLILKDESIPSSYKWMAIFSGAYNGRIALEDLRGYLEGELTEGKKVWKNPAIVPTELRKLLCLYDVKKYGELE